MCRAGQTGCRLRSNTTRSARVALARIEGQRSSRSSIRAAHYIYIAELGRIPVAVTSGAIASADVWPARGKGQRTPPTGLAGEVERGWQALRNAGRPSYQAARIVEIPVQ